MPVDPATALPRRVFLFSGHMVDAPGRAVPRFPDDKAPLAAAAIGRRLDRLCGSGGDLAICGAACGGDLIFAEACLARGLALEFYLPFDEATFLAASVDFAGADWHARYHAAKARAALHIAPEELGPLPAGTDAYERNNLWMLGAAGRFGADKVELIALWNGQDGDGPGGTRHLIAEVRRRGGRAHWIDTRTLWR